jgi:hypothetical protein
MANLQEEIYLYIQTQTLGDITAHILALGTISLPQDDVVFKPTVLVLRKT